MKKFTLQGNIEFAINDSLNLKYCHHDIHINDEDLAVCIKLYQENQRTVDRTVHFDARVKGDDLYLSNAVAGVAPKDAKNLYILRKIDRRFETGIEWYDQDARFKDYVTDLQQKTYDISLDFNGALGIYGFKNIIPKEERTVAQQAVIDQFERTLAELERFTNIDLDEL